MVSIGALVLLLCLLQIKHLFADYFLQTAKMLSGRDQYLHAGRAQHAAVHAAGTVLVFLVLGAPAGFVVAIAALEWVVHFHIDYGKARYSVTKELNPSQSLFWRAMGTDQFLHQITYVAMVWAWLVFAL